ncbi:hypothetical protein pdul_cds_789 [Pandoravirus dulcis]|uniref:Uncharacterized protein n=1 Tax=Pandoravirus dulcis TaxID=1349409 RepID=S4VUC1_9VIRU|nr:hypothetical protein pdul_cds_789 [Pandoravirus dulcis]AGO82985.1 hypothetical protein pdul_cds_789 [Pandoravirus dulcis]
MNTDLLDPIAPVEPSAERGPADDTQDKDVACPQTAAATAPLSAIKPRSEDADPAGFLSDALCQLHAPQPTSPLCAVQKDDYDNNSDLDTGRRRRIRHRDDDNRADTWPYQMMGMALVALAVSIFVVTIMRPLPASGVDGASSNTTEPAIVDHAAALSSCYCTMGSRQVPTIEGRLTVNGSSGSCACTWPVEQPPLIEAAERWALDVFSNVDVLIEPLKMVLFIVVVSLASNFFISLCLWAMVVLCGCRRQVVIYSR